MNPVAQAAGPGELTRAATSLQGSAPVSVGQVRARSGAVGRGPRAGGGGPRVGV